METLKCCGDRTHCACQSYLDANIQKSYMATERLQSLLYAVDKRGQSECLCKVIAIHCIAKK